MAKVIRVVGDNRVTVLEVAGAAATTVGLIVLWGAGVAWLFTGVALLGKAVELETRRRR